MSDIFSGARVQLQRLLLALVFSLATIFPFTVLAGGEKWVSTWAASQQGPEPQFMYTLPDPGQFVDQSIRQIVHTSVGGKKLRVHISNEFGTQPLSLGGAHIAQQSVGADIVPGTDHVLYFGGAASVVIPPGSAVVSDAVDLVVPALGNMAITIYLPTPAATETFHSKAMQNNFISTVGNHCGDIVFPVASTVQSNFFIAGLDVVSANNAAVIVALGDSIAEGEGSTVDANLRWPNLLAERLRNTGAQNIAVLNHGISANRILDDFIGPSAQARFTRDVLGVPGIEYVILLVGINDIGMDSWLVPAERNPALVADMITAYQNLITRAHAAGLKIYGGTLMPYEGFAGYTDPAGEVQRQAINQWMRTSGAFDALLDFDLVMRDPSHPARLLPAYDSGDHIHPSDAGHQAVANAIDPALFITEKGYRRFAGYRH